MTSGPSDRWYDPPDPPEPIRCPTTGCKGEVYPGEACDECEEVCPTEDELAEDAAIERAESMRDDPGEPPAGWEP